MGRLRTAAEFVSWWFWRNPDAIAATVIVVFVLAGAVAASLGVL